MPKLFMVDKRALECTFLDSGSVSGSNTTYTVSGLSFGAADAERNILVCIGWGSAGSTAAPTTVTIGGVTAAIIDSGNATGTGFSSGIWSAAVPSGTSGSVVLTFSGSPVRNIGVSLYGVKPDLSVASSATAFDTTSPVTVSTSIDALANGVAVAVAHGNGGGSATWTGLTEDLDTSVGGPSHFSAASQQFASDQTGLAVSAAITVGTVGHMTIVVLSP